MFKFILAANVAMSSFHVSKASGPSVHIHVVLLGQSVSKNGQGVLGAHNVFGIFHSK